MWERETPPREEGAPDPPPPPSPRRRTILETPQRQIAIRVPAGTTLRAGLQTVIEQVRRDMVSTAKIDVDDLLTLLEHLERMPDEEEPDGSE